MAVSSAQASGDPRDTGRMLPDSIAVRALERAERAGAAYAEVRLVSNRSTSIEVRDGELHKAVPGHDLAATLRVLADGAWGTWSTSDLPSLVDMADGTVAMAKQVAATRGAGDEPIRLAEVPILTDDVHWRPGQDVRDVELEHKLGTLAEFHGHIQTDDRIISVTTGHLDEHLHTELRTTEGMDRAWSIQRTVANAIITARDQGTVASYRTRIGGGGGYEAIERHDLEDVGRRATTSVLRILGAERAPSGKLPLIADPDLAGVYIHEAVGHPCEADLVAAGDSCLDGRLNTRIGSEIVSVVDDPQLRQGYGAYPIDDEGVDVRTKRLITNGILTEYLNHRESAAAFDLEPNGGARAQDGLHHPLVRMSNTIIEGRTHADLDELLADVQHGVYACGTRGGQVDTGLGSFQFAAQEAWLIEDGQLTTPLKDVSVSGMTLEILSNIDGLASDGGLAAPGFCGKGQTVPVGDGGPHVRISEALIG